ncbi:response regulator [Paenibacillus puldeungensis]|uniref:Response regulator n=1 Tax=Paenibacillus puldeungensis TaxID=696536 RepID=A0ABW3RXP3_9BACL
MYNVMIVEDSKPILRNIKTLLSTMELPLRIVATAANGEEALEKIQRESVHLLLTDIRMPKMDGLTLIEQAKLRNPQLKVVLISGYSDFEYTRKALNLQVFDYLLKPVERKALEEVMERAIGQLNQRIVNDRDLLKEIVEPSYYAEIKLNQEFTHFAKVMLIARRQPFSPGKDEWKREKMEYLLKQIFAPHECWVFPAQIPQEYIVFVNRAAAGMYSSIYECLESVRRHLVGHGMDAIIGGQLLSSESGRLPELYYRASGMLSEQQRITQGFVIDTGTSASQAGIVENLMEPTTLTAFVQMIREQRKEQFALKLTEQMVKWAEEHVRVAEVERFLGLLVDTFARLCEERGAEIRLGLELKAKQLFEENSYADFCRELVEWTRQCFDILQTHSRTSGQELFEKMDEYVKMNMYAALSINDIALKFHVSPSYISRVIKKYTQTTFVQYYTELKIKEACRLLEERPDMKFKELSDLLSFSDQHYFSKVFKEYTGYSPTEYKEKLVGKLE